MASSISSQSTQKDTFQMATQNTGSIHSHTSGKKELGEYSAQQKAEVDSFDIERQDPPATSPITPRAATLLFIGYVCRNIIFSPMLLPLFYASSAPISYTIYLLSCPSPTPIILTRRSTVCAPFHFIAFCHFVPPS